MMRQYELVDRVKAYYPQADGDLLDRAYVFALKAHGEQTRKSGEPYFTHPLAVAEILTDLKADPASVATALLHDTVEDTDATLEDIAASFGEEIASLVDGVTKLSQIKLRSPETKQAENFRKLVVAMADDVRVLLVKLADRLHNMRTLQFHPVAEKRRRIAMETLDIYAPLAGRIGVHKISEELEDLSFAELNADAYGNIVSRLDALQAAIGQEVAKLATLLRDRLDQAGVPAEVYSREKRAYSIFRKMADKNLSFDELADIYAFRILTDSVEDCYRALSVIHTGWRMIPTEFDDYVSAPKPNGYRSIHTAVIGPPRPDGGRQRVEVQIRTRDMHEAAERGVAAHWQYKDPGANAGFELFNSIQYDPYETPRRLVDMFQMGEDPNEALAYAKLELFQDQVFAFTPKGRVIALPKDATLLDFAYAVHTDIGDSCVGAKVNGVQRPLRTPLRNGDVVDVLRSANATPPPEWERIAVTGRARGAIRRRIKKMQVEEQIRIGRRVAEDVFQGAQLDFSPKAIRAALQRLGSDSVDDVLARVGRAELSPADLVEAVYPGASIDSESEIRTPVGTIFQPRFAIDGLPAKAPVRIGQCCTPVPGERIVGIRAADGPEVTVHTIYCERLARDDPPQERWLDLQWREDRKKVSALTRIAVVVRNDIGVLSDVAGVIARYGVSIVNIRLEAGKTEFVTLIIDIEVKTERQVQLMLAGLRASNWVVSAERNAPGDDAPAAPAAPAAKEIASAR
ncbi:MAG: bifunctional (p)ppGpp synthetase/guanosine-3',5'-bis(diphosphate) 3'-pyrophosphohydrolase [Pseudomonadota bacterium]